MVSNSTRKAISSSYSTLQLTRIAQNDFKADIGVRRIQQIMFDVSYMKCLKMQKAPRMSSDNRICRVEWALNYMKKDQDFDNL